MITVILSGGSGTRMWPYSRSMHPKQFLPLVGENSMLQETIMRLGDDIEPLVVCNEDHRFMVAEQLRAMNIEANSILLEPEAKNTAPAITLAALKVMEKGEDDTLLVLPADHIIPDSDAFRAALKVAEKQTSDGSLVTFGIVPTYAEVGYGYIKAAGDKNVRLVDEFLEKPSLEKAQVYVESGDYFWNSGMFMFKASIYLEEIKKYSPEILSSCKKALSLSKADLDFIRVDRKTFSSCPSDSIDYAVMEKTDLAVMVPFDAGWNDVGSWASLWSVYDKDEKVMRFGVM